MLELIYKSGIDPEDMLVFIDNSYTTYCIIFKKAVLDHVYEN